MRYYKCDGTSCKINEEDRDFGWWLCDSESVENKTGKTSESQSDSESDSEWLFVDKEPKTKNIAKKPRRETSSDSENDIDNPFSKQAFNPNLISLTEIRRNLTNIITSNSIESRLLLSIVDVHKFNVLLQEDGHTITQSYENITELEGPSPLFLSKSYIEKLHDNPKVKSLLNELSLNFTSTEVLLTHNSTTNLNELTNNLKMSEKLDCFPSDSLKLSSTTSWSKKFLESSELLFKNLKTLNDEIYNMKKELIDIRNDFHEDDKKTGILFYDCKCLLRKIKENNYMNELIPLLMGQVEKLLPKNRHFNIDSNSENQINLII